MTVYNIMKVPPCVTAPLLSGIQDDFEACVLSLYYAKKFLFLELLSI